MKTEGIAGKEIRPDVLLNLDPLSCKGLKVAGEPEGCEWRMAA